MAANDFTELIAWQRADALERFVLTMLTHPILAKDRKFCEQVSDSANSASRNIAEGYSRFAPPQFANLLRIAIGSEGETRSQIIQAWRRGALTDQQKDEGLLLCKRALTAAIRLRLYLDSSEARRHAKEIETATKQRLNDEADATGESDESDKSEESDEPEEPEEPEEPDEPDEPVNL